MNETTAQALTRDDVRAIASEEISKAAGLIGNQAISALSGEGQSERASARLDERLDSIRIDIQIPRGLVLKRDGDGWMEPQKLPNAGGDVLNAETEPRGVFTKTQLHSYLNVNQTLVSKRKGLIPIVDCSHNSSPSVVDAGAHSVGDGPGAGGASANPATEVTDPHISARYDAPLNAIAMSVGGTDDLYFDRDATFLLVDELLTALRDQAKNGGLA